MKKLERFQIEEKILWQILGGSSHGNDEGGPPDGF